MAHPRGEYWVQIRDWSLLLHSSLSDDTSKEPFDSSVPGTNQRWAIKASSAYLLQGGCVTFECCLWVRRTCCKPLKSHLSSVSLLTHFHALTQHYSHIACIIKGHAWLSHLELIVHCASFKNSLNMAQLSTKAKSPLQFFNTTAYPVTPSQASSLTLQKALKRHEMDPPEADILCFRSSHNGFPSARWTSHLIDTPTEKRYRNTAFSSKKRLIFCHLCKTNQIELIAPKICWGTHKMGERSA